MKSRNTSDGTSPEFTCDHLKSLETNAHAGTVKIDGIWTLCCTSCVAHFIGNSVRRGRQPAQIARAVHFRSCNHKKREGTGCRTCLAAVKRIVKRVLWAYDTDAVLSLLTQQRKPKGEEDTFRRFLQNLSADSPAAS